MFLSSEVFNKVLSGKSICKIVFLLTLIHWKGIGGMVYSQIDPTIQWQNTIGGDSIDLLQSIQQTADGGYILGGSSLSSISYDKTENNLGGADYWIIKTDAAGNLQWQNTIGGNKNDYLYCIQQTADGGYILGGISQSSISGDKIENNIDSICLPFGCTYDYWIVKTDASGNIQWQNTIGGSEDDRLNSVWETVDGGYILAGYSDSDSSGDKTEDCLGSQFYGDYWIVRTDAAGNIQWENTIGGSSDEWLSAVQQSSDGGYILGGWSNSNISGDKTENCNGGADYWIVKTNAAGNIEWQNTIGGNYGDLLNSIQQTADGGYILGGASDSNISADKTEHCLGLKDYWIIKTDAIGNIEWQNTIGGNKGDYLYGIQQTVDGGYILGGYSWSDLTGDKTENCLGVEDYWILKTDVLGNIQWQNTIGGIYYDNLYSIYETSDGGFILGGYSVSKDSLDKSEDCLGGEDYWIIKLQSCSTCTEVNTLFTSNITINGATLSWAGISCAICYSIRFRKVGTSTWFSKKTVCGQTSKAIINLQSNTQYEWQVRSKCSQVPLLLSPWSASSFFTTQ